MKQKFIKLLISDEYTLSSELREIIYNLRYEKVEYITGIKIQLVDHSPENTNCPVFRNEYKVMINMKVLNSESLYTTFYFTPPLEIDKIQTFDLIFDHNIDKLYYAHVILEF